jgi:hypothetical protein
VTLRQSFELVDGNIRKNNMKKIHKPSQSIEQPSLSLARLKHISLTRELTILNSIEPFALS